MILLLMLAAWQRLQPLDISLSGNYFDGVINQEGSVFFAGFDGLQRIDLRTGAQKKEIFRTVVQFHPLRAVSGTIEQGLTRQGSAAQRPDTVLDAKGSSRVALCTGPQIPGSEPTKLLVFTLADLDGSGLSANRNWSVRERRGHSSLAVAARIGKDSTVFWTLEGESRLTELFRYTCARSLRKSRVGRTTVPNLYAATYNPSNERFVFLEMNRETLRNRTGLVIRSEPAPQLREGATRDMATKNMDLVQAVWDLTVPSKAIPGGKETFLPIRYSANWRIWLIRRKSDQRLFLLTL